MFKAIHAKTEEFVILLDPQWQERLAELRALDAENQFLCQECRQPVAVRAGAVRRWYFAHKRRRDCPYGQESPTLLAARAVLYRRLQEVFGAAVTLEKRLADSRLSRPVDCWVEGKETPIAYWILESGMKSQEERTSLQGELWEAGAYVVWLFTSEMLHESAETGTVHLTTTERDFLQHTYFDFDKRLGSDAPGGTLHYLNHQEETLTTFRLLQCVHKPQVYKGHRLSHPFSAVQIAKTNGELAHPGEREHRESLKQERKRQILLAQTQQKRDEEHREARSATGDPGQPTPLTVARLASMSHNGPREVPSQRSERAGKCKFCGTVTEDWVAYEEGVCRCRECYRKGLF